MKKFIIFFNLFLYICFQPVYANEINIASFQELMNTSLNNGDTFNFTQNLTSDETIGQHFYNYNINFEGNNYYINGENQFGGFILSKDNDFNQINIQNCKGQYYSGSYFAGAIFNSGGHTDIQNSSFTHNFADQGNSNFGVAGAVYNLFGGSMSLENTTFIGNYTSGAGSYGGAVANGYNDNGTAQMTIKNALFENNHSTGDSFAQGGALYNNGVININNVQFNNNYIDLIIVRPEDYHFLYGGAINNNQGDMTIENSSFNGNYIKGDTASYTYGGAIYNNTNANLTIKNSILENNYISNDTERGEGGAIYNAGNLDIECTTFKNNYDLKNGLNDIENTSTGTVNFLGSCTNNILSGIAGVGTITKQDTGVLNLGGVNNKFTGNFDFEGGTLNLLADSSYFEATNTSFGSNVNFNMANGEINNINWGNLTLNGKTKLFADVNFNTNTMDMINAASVEGNGTIYVGGFNIEGVPESTKISIPFADNTLKNYVTYTPSTIHTPIYNYNVSYDSNNGYFDFLRQGFDSSILVSPVAAQLAGYLAQIDSYKNIFANLDMVMINPQRVAFSRQNKIAFSNNNFAYSPFLMPEQRNGIWFKPYSSFETVSLKNGPSVSNVSYGSMIGAESGLKKLKNDWYSIYGLYLTYNGSHQSYQGNSIYNNGGQLGIDTVFYKGNFFTAWTANVGANSAQATTNFGNENFTMLNTGIAQMTGYNWGTLKNKLIIQPSILTSYSFINTFNYKNASDVDINTEPIQALQIEPKIKLIGNFENFVQPYAFVSVVWNIIDHAKFKADDVYLSNLAIKPFVQYGVGIQKRWGERVTGFFETMLRNGGRNGVALMLGIRISI